MFFSNGFLRQTPCRVSCFAHLVGAERGKARGVDDSTEEEKTWRSGIFKTVSKELVDAKYLDLIEDFVYGTRCLTAIPFSVLWKALLNHLDDVKEHAAADTLRRYYLQEDDEGRYTASWRLGCDRVTPSQIPGSQAQESWHCHRLRVAISGLRVPFSDALSKLEKLMTTRADELIQGPAAIHTIPGSKWKHDLISGDALPVVGRTPVRMYLTSGVYEHKQAHYVQMWIEP